MAAKSLLSIIIFLSNSDLDNCQYALQFLAGVVRYDVYLPCESLKMQTRFLFGSNVSLIDTCKSRTQHSEDEPSVFGGLLGGSSYTGRPPLSEDLTDASWNKP